MRRPAARPRDVRLHDIDGTAIDQLAEAVKAVLGLVAGDRGGERGGDACAAVDVVGRNRLLDPVKPLCLHRAAHLDREIGAPSAINIDHQLTVRPERLPHGRDPRQILRGLDL